MKILITLIVFTILYPINTNAELNSTVRQEIRHLFTYLQNSKCRFNRNGTWYGTQEAINHLNRKYEYLVNRNLISSTESFIERAASKSSWTGKPYVVQCNSTPAVESGTWFKIELKKYRSTKEKSHSSDR